MSDDARTFEAEALDELAQVRELIENNRRALLAISMGVAKDTGSVHAAMARMWLLGAVESQLWRIERKLKGDQM